MHDELQAIASAAQSAFQQVELDGWDMDGSLAESVRLRHKAKWGDEWVNASTFLHLERLDVQKILRNDPDGFIHIVDYCDAWEKLCSQLFALQAQLSVVFSGWMLHEGARGDISELVGYVSPANLSALLSAATYQISAMSAFASVMGIVVQEEINAWYGEGQWKVGSNASVKAALKRVRIIIVGIFFFLHFVLCQRVASRTGSRTFIHRNCIFTVNCLLPGHWLNGDVMNFIIDSWQPLFKEGVLLMDTYFWPTRLKRVRSARQSEAWDQVLGECLLKVRCMVSSMS